MTNRFLILFALFALVFTGCPAPDEDGDNYGFIGTVTFTSSNEIRQIDLRTGNISVVGEGHSPCVAANSDVFASIGGTGIVKYSGGLRSTILASNDNISDLELSPLENKLAYVVASDVVILDLATSISDTINSASRPQWLSDSKVLIQRGEELLSIDIHNHTETPIANIGNGRDACVSPDRSRIAFVEGKDLFVMNADGSSMKPIMSGHIELRYPAWSRDGKYIVVKDDCDLKIFNVSGGMVQSFRGHFFSFTDAQCPDASQICWR